MSSPHASSVAAATTTPAGWTDPTAGSPALTPTPVPPSAPPTDAPLPTRPAELPPFGELVASARPATYQQLLSNPARYDGDLLYFRGRVRRVADDGRGSFQATIAVVGGELVIAYDAATYFGHPLVRGDSVRFVGSFAGLTTDAAGNRVPLVDLIEIIIRFT